LLSTDIYYTDRPLQTHSNVALLITKASTNGFQDLHQTVS